MPADQSNIGMGRRRQGDTEPDRSDDRNRSLDRAIDEEQSPKAPHERGRESGASGAAAPHAPAKPGTQSDLEDAGVTENLDR